MNPDLVRRDAEGQLFVWDLQLRRPIAEKRFACSPLSDACPYYAAACVWPKLRCAVRRLHSAEAGIISLHVLGDARLLRCCMSAVSCSPPHSLCGL